MHYHTVSNQNFVEYFYLKILSSNNYETLLFIFQVKGLRESVKKYNKKYFNLFVSSFDNVYCHHQALCMNTKENVKHNRSIIYVILFVYVSVCACMCVCASACAVSYTHLDVYKRQGDSNATSSHPAMPDCLSEFTPLRQLLSLQLEA